MNDSVVQRAKDMAHRAHAGQVDKVGRPYIEHVARVAAAVADDSEAEAVAWLHDVIEDCGLGDDVQRLFPHTVSEAVIRLTNYRVAPLASYYQNIRRHPLALRVKLADIADNADEARLSRLDGKTADRLRKKYAKALKALTN